MPVIRGKDWIRNTRIRLQGLTAKVKRPRYNKEKISRLQRWIGNHKAALAKSAAAVAILIGISAGGNQYIESKTIEIHHVYLDGKEIGVVSDLVVIDQAVHEKHTEVQSANPDVHMFLETSTIDFESELVFKGEYDNEAAASAIKEQLVARPVGVKLLIDGEVIAVLKNREEAKEILEQFQDKYGQLEQKKEQKVSILEAQEVMAAPVDTKVVKSVEFTKPIEFEEVILDSEDDFHEPNGVLDLLESMGSPPVTYVVQPGDCLGCIAEKFGYGQEEVDMLRTLNPWIVDDMIRVGDEMIIRGFEPTLGVKTIEIAVEQEEIQHDIIYETDDTLRLGKTRTIKPGKNGLKKVTWELTSINGRLVGEVLIGEEVLEPPVAAVMAKGTKRLLGEGTGKFAWPVSGAKLTSSFGKRWGTQHKGIDLASKNRDIKASDTGKVIFAGTKNGYGKTVIIDHRNGYETLYAHLSKISVSKGDIVEKGDKIGVMGSTGRSTGVHLHFEIHSNGKVQNPIKYLN